jgi:ATP-binding protein involved in chromosome partitioning
MFEKVGVPIVGIVENMSIHVCSNCGHAEHIFGEGGAQRMCAEYDVPFLGGFRSTSASASRPTPDAPRSWRIPTARSLRSTRNRAQGGDLGRAKGGGLLGQVPSIVIQNT